MKNFIIIVVLALVACGEPSLEEAQKVVAKHAPPVPAIPWTTHKVAYRVIYGERHNAVSNGAAIRLHYYVINAQGQDCEVSPYVYASATEVNCMWERHAVLHRLPKWGDN
jgi:hypothetical protein